MRFFCCALLVVSCSWSPGPIVARSRHASSSSRLAPRLGAEMTAFKERDAERMGVASCQVWVPFSRRLVGDFYRLYRSSVCRRFWVCCSRSVHIARAWRPAPHDSRGHGARFARCAFVACDALAELNAETECARVQVLVCKSGLRCALGLSLAHGRQIGRWAGLNSAPWISFADRLQLSVRWQSIATSARGLIPQHVRGMARPPTGRCRVIFSADLNVLVRCRVERLLPASCAELLVGDDPLDIELALVADGVVVASARSSQTMFETLPEDGPFRQQHFAFAVKVRDLPLESSFVVRLRPQGGSRKVHQGVLPLFNRHATLRQGDHLLALQEVDGEVESLPSNWRRHTNEDVLQASTHELREALRLMQARGFLDRGCLPAASTGFKDCERHFASQAEETLAAAGIPWLRTMSDRGSELATTQERRKGVVKGLVSTAKSASFATPLEHASVVLTSPLDRFDPQGSGGGIRADCEPKCQLHRLSLFRLQRLASESVP